MKLSKKIFFTVTVVTVCAGLYAQEQKVQKKDGSNSNAKSETSVENEYLNDMDGTVILTLAQSEEYDNKLVALQYLETSVEKGNTSDEVVAALDQLAGEGISTQTRKNGRLMNNYPDIRRQACLLLGKIGGEHSKNTLKNIALADNEPSVQAAAIKSLGDIGINANDEVTEAIAYANLRNRVLNPTSSMAFEVLNAFEKLSANTQNKKAMIDEISHIAADSHYNSAVRKHALDILKNMKTDSSDTSSTKKSSTQPEPAVSTDTNNAN
ncbi:MAG: HEAT repeat domain-containing protein [Treponema sp.]|nr:HEAT repeat domain-containing protein [Treponema sp.]